MRFMNVYIYKLISLLGRKAWSLPSHQTYWIKCCKAKHKMEKRKSIGNGILSKLYWLIRWKTNVLLEQQLNEQIMGCSYDQTRTQRNRGS